MSGAFKRPGPPPSGAPKASSTFVKPSSPERKPLATLEKKDITEELRINDVHVNEELIGQPLLMKKYCEELAKLNKKVKSIKNKLELQEAGVYVLLSNDGKGRKVAEIESMVIQDAEVQRLRVELYDAEEQAETYVGIVRSLAQRADSLQQLSNNLRKEVL